MWQRSQRRDPGPCSRQSTWSNRRSASLRSLRWSTKARSERVAEEKGKLVEALPANGLAILNYDDPCVAAMAERTRARVVTFGQTGGDYVVSNVRCEAPGRLGLTLTHRGQAFEITSGLTGVHQSVAVAAAFACTHQLGVPPALIVERIANFEAVFGRCSVHRVENGPIFIADTVKAPYHSLQLALDMMAEFTAPRKRIVLGQLSDFAGSNRVYQKAYQAARSVADQVLFVGEHSHRSKASAEDIATQRFVGTQSVEDAARFVKTTAIPDEIVLVKSSKKLHLERIILNFGVEVRCWEQACGKMSDCNICGRFTIPFEKHKAHKIAHAKPSIDIEHVVWAKAGGHR
jgi:UDP-N-acetylmuramoyl-tripeptide--D-alanyl-D-alanine ligase